MVAFDCVQGGAGLEQLVYLFLNSLGPLVSVRVTLSPAGTGGGAVLWISLSMSL